MTFGQSDPLMHIEKTCGPLRRSRDPYRRYQGPSNMEASSMISEARVEKAVEFLRDTSEVYGRQRGFVAYCENNLRRVKSMQMLEHAGKSIGAQEAAAYASIEYHEALEALQNAVADCETTKAKREAAELTIEVWRSQNAARRQGVTL